jgi:SPP1 family phage portal protein
MPYFSGTDTVKLQMNVAQIKSDSKLITAIIERWEQSHVYRHMIEGEKYYSVRHEICHKDFTKAYIFNKDINDFVQVENKNASNLKTINPFLRYLNRQKTNYIAGKRIQFTVKDAENNTDAETLQENINNELNDYFESTAYDLVLHASNKGMEVLMPFINADGKFDYRIAPAQNIIPDYDEETGQLISVMRYYEKDYLADNDEQRDSLRTSSQLMEVRRVEIWTKEDVSYYVQDSPGGLYVFESSRSHFELTNPLLNPEDQTAKGSWGRPPFIFLNNNSEKESDLLPIKSLLGAYDAVSTGFFQDVDTIQSVVYHVNDYGGTDAKEIPQMLKLFKSISTQGPDGKVEAIQIEIPFEAKKEILSILEKNIFRFGEGVDLTAVNKGANIPIIGVEVTFNDLYLKGNNTISQLKLALKDFIWFLIFYMQNKKMPGRVDSKNVQLLADSVSAVIKVSKISNDTELITNLLASKGIMSNEAIMNKHPYIDDVETNKAQLEEEATVNLDTVPPDMTNTDMNKQKQKQVAV